MSVTDTQSYSAVIRDALFAKAVTLPFFAGFKARRSKQLPIQEQMIPYLGVYIIDEQMGPDGEINATDIKFTHTLRIGFSVIIQNNDPVESELTLDAAFWALMNGLWRDGTLTNFLVSSIPDNTHMEGIRKGTRRHVWGNAGLNNEKPVAELQYEASIEFRTSWTPIITDDLLHIHTESVPMRDDGSVPAAAEVLRIIAEYEFTPAKGVEP